MYTINYFNKIDEIDKIIFLYTIKINTFSFLYKLT